MKIRKKIVFLLLMCIVICSSLQAHAVDTTAVSQSVFTTYRAGQTVKVYRHLKGAYDNSYFEIEGYAVSWAICAQNSKASWAEHNNYGVYRTGVLEEWDNATLRKVLYYSPGSEGYSWILALKGWKSITGNGEVADMNGVHDAVGLLNHDSGNAARGQAYIDIINQYNLPDPQRWGYQAFYVRTGDGTQYQNVAFLGAIAYGSIDVIKYSSNSQITNHNKKFTLGGAVYDIYYQDGDYSSPDYTVTLGEYSDGWSQAGLAAGVKYGWGSISVPQGNYYVKERTAPKGFKLNNSWYPSNDSPIRVNANQSSYIYATDEPDVGSLDIIKYSTNSALTNNSSDYTLGDAVYGIYEQDGDYSSPEYTVRLKEYSDGWSQTGLVVGEKYGWVTITLPVGNYYVKELSAPKGFELNDSWYPSAGTPITVGSGITRYIYAYDDPIVTEEPVKIKLIKKTRLEEEYVLCGAEFTHIKPDGTKEMQSTDSAGEICFMDLKAGEHTIYETKAPDGFEINSNKIQFTVTSDNQLTFRSSNEADGTIVQQIDSDGNGEIICYNQMKPIQIKINKHDEKGVLLTHAEFTIAMDEKFEQVIETAKTVNGELKFQNLKPATWYYLVETKAPPGYVLPDKSESEEHIYKIFFGYNEGAGVFVECESNSNWNENGTTDGKGFIKIGETFKSASCHLNEDVLEVSLDIINKVGKKLPNTGSSATVIMISVGIGLVSVSLLKNKYSKYQERKNL